MTALTKEQTDSIKRSYLNIVGLFLNEERIDSRYLRCLLKWGFQLHINPDDLRRADIDITHLKFLYPHEKVESIEAIYHLVHMICLDSVVEDIELEMASVYAEKLGFKNTLVSDLFKSIATADSDGNPPGNVRQQVMDFLKVYEG